MMEGNAATAALVPLLTGVNRFPEKIAGKTIADGKPSSAERFVARAGLSFRAYERVLRNAATQQGTVIAAVRLPRLEQSRR